MPGLGLTRYLSSRFCDTVGLRTRLQDRIWAEHEKSHVVDPLMLEVLDLQLVACVHVAADCCPHGPAGFQSVDLTRLPRPIDGEVTWGGPRNAFPGCRTPLSNRTRPPNPPASGPTPWRAFRIFKISRFLRR